MNLFRYFWKLVRHTITYSWWENSRTPQCLRTIDSITILSIDRPQYDPAGPPSTVTDLGSQVTPLINFPPYKAPRLSSSNTDLILGSQNNGFETLLNFERTVKIIFILGALFLAYQVCKFVTWLLVKFCKFMIGLLVEFCKFVGLFPRRRQSRQARDFEIHKAASEGELVAANVEITEKEDRIKTLEKDCIRKDLVIKANKNVRTRDKGTIKEYEDSLQDALDELPPLRVKFTAHENTKTRLEQEIADLKTVEINLRQELNTQAEARTRDREEVVTRREEESNALRGDLKESERVTQLLLESQTEFQAEAKVLRDSDAKLRTEIAGLRSRADEAEEWRDEYKMQAEASAASLALRVQEIRKKNLEGGLESKCLRESQTNLRKAYKLIRDADRRAAAAEEDAVTSKKNMKAGEKALSALQDDHSKMSVKYQTAAKQLLELESELSKEKAEVVKWTDTVSHYDNEFGEQLKKNTSLHSMNNNLQKERIALRKEIVAAVKANEDLAEKNKQLQVQDQKWKVAFDQRVDSYISELDKKDKEINEVKRVANQYYHAHNTLQQSLEKEEKKLQECQGELATVRTELAAVKTELDAVKAGPDTVATELNTPELDTLKTELVTVKTELDAVKKVLAATKSDADFQKRAFEGLSEKHETGRVNFNKMKAGYNKNRDLIETLKAKITSLEDDQDKPKTSNAANPAASKQLQSQMMNLLHANTTMKKEKDALQFQANCMNVGFGQLRILGIYPVEPLTRNGKGLHYKTGSRFLMVYRDRRDNAIKDFDRSSCSYLAIKETKQENAEKALIRQQREGPQRRRHSITYGEQTILAAAFFRPGDVQKRSGMKMPLHRNQRPREDSQITYHTKDIMAAVDRLAKYLPGAKRLEIASDDDIVLILSEREPYEDVELRANLGHLWIVQDNILKHQCNSQGVMGPLGKVLTIDNAVEQRVLTERQVAHWGEMRDIHDMHVDWRARETRVGWIHDEIMKWRENHANAGLNLDLSKEKIEALVDLA